jgi:hypothetical protein
MLTPIELECLELLEDLIRTFGPGKVERKPFREIMGRVGRMKVRLENIKDGSRCPFGHHVADCNCRKNVA